MSTFHLVAIEECKVTFLLEVLDLIPKVSVPIRVGKDLAHGVAAHFDKDFQQALYTKGRATTDEWAAELWGRTRDLVEEKVREMAVLSAGYALAQKGTGMEPQIARMKDIAARMGDVATTAIEYAKNQSLRAEVARLKHELERRVITIAEAVKDATTGGVDITEDHLRWALGAVKPHCTITTEEETRLVYCAFAFPTSE